MEEELKRHETTDFSGMIKVSNNRGLKFLIFLLILIILGMAGYICYDKGVFNDLLEKYNIIKKDDPKEEDKLSEEEVKKLHDSLMVNDEFGPYYTINISVDNIKPEQFIAYVLSNYVKDRDIKGTEFNLMCINAKNDDKEWIEECNKDKSTAASVSKEEIKSYIKEKYNIDKDFNFESNFEYVSNSTVRGFLYSKDDSRFYFGFGPGAQGEQKVFTKFIKSEQSGDELYVYDQAILCISGYNSIGCYKGFGEANPDTDKSIYKAEGSAFDLDQDSLFEKVEDKVLTFKHTFKQGTDGNYYWYSSEIVNE